MSERWSVETLDNGNWRLWANGRPVVHWWVADRELFAAMRKLVEAANRADRVGDWVRVGDDDPVVSATVVDVLTEKIEAQQVEILDLKARLLVNGNFIGERYDQARQHIKGLRVLADLYEQKLDGPPKD